MQIIYYLLMFSAYFAVVTDRQAGGGGGGGGGVGYYGEGSSNCTTDACGRDASIIGGSVFDGFGGLYVIYCCCNCRTFRKNSTFVKVAKSNNLNQVAPYVNIFQSDNWSSRYFQYKQRRGPHQFSFSFDPQSMKVTGSGTDNIGKFVIDAISSIETCRMGLTKRYQLGTGNLSENSVHEVTIQLTWNAQNNQFEGKWYVQTSQYCCEDKFELKFDGQHLSTVYQKM